jgi:hypothetical protein
VVVFSAGPLPVMELLCLQHLNLMVVGQQEVIVCYQDLNFTSAGVQEIIGRGQGRHGWWLDVLYKDKA